MFRSLTTAGIDGNVAQYLNLAGEANVGVLLAIIAQPEFLHKGEVVGIGRGRDDDAVCPTEAVPVAIQDFPHAAVDGNVVLQRGVANMIAHWHIDLYIFANKSNRWHDSILQSYVWVTQKEITILVRV